jgi:hypothetical protein
MLIYRVSFFGKIYILLRQGINYVLQKTLLQECARTVQCHLKSILYASSNGRLTEISFRELNNFNFIVCVFTHNNLC